MSIRQRALELIYQLVNEQNVVALTAELLNYLIVANVEHKVRSRSISTLLLFVHIFVRSHD